MIIRINPVGRMSLLSQMEVDQLTATASSTLSDLYRNCSLAVLNAGRKTDDAHALLAEYQSFNIAIIRRARGVKLELTHPPQHAFVDGDIIRNIQDHLFSVLRDILFLNRHPKFNLTSGAHITNFIFDILRNANTLHANEDPNIVVCWGGHAINDQEYQYTREVGHELGLRGLNICTGCGPGEMEGPMKGATIGHAKQRQQKSRFIGLTEPSIIASEPPNPIVNELVILPDIEKRLEAFIRLGHAIIIFPGGVGTAEELLYILGIVMHPDNHNNPLPIFLTGPKSSKHYFDSLNTFLCNALGEEVTQHYQIIIGAPQSVAKAVKQGISKVRAHRKSTGDAYSFHWSLTIAPEFQQPFIPTHETMDQLQLHHHQRTDQLIIELRRAFSGIVAGNVKSDTLLSIKKRGPFQLKGDPQLLQALETLLHSFIQQGRMSLSSQRYQPCYQIKKTHPTSKK